MPAHPRARPLDSAQLLSDFESYLHQHALSPVTIRNYIADLRSFLRWHNERHHYAHGLAPPAFRAYRAFLCDESNHSTATVNRRLQSLRLFGRFMHETGRADENPSRDLALLHADNGRAPRTLSPSEIERFVDAVRAGRPSLVLRDVAIVQLMLQAGLRVQEIARLRLGDLSGAPRLRVAVQSSRRNGSRTVPLNALASRALRDYLAARPATPKVDHLFISQRGQPLSLRAIQRMVDTYGSAAELRHVSAQSLRHTCARRMLQETGDVTLVAKWLGNKSVRTLVKYGG